ncbi:MAG: phenylacetate--CoA ligase family protein, partial [Ktedonobacteraceae bacterium]
AKQYMADPGRTELLLDRYRVMITSGSSGLPGVFLYNQTEWGSVMASLARLISWLSPAARSKPAIIGTTSPWYMTAYIQKSLQAQGGGSGIRLAVTDPITTTVQRLNDAQPTALLGYPSVIRMLADEQRKGRLHIAPYAVVCASEVLSENVRQQIEDVWHIKPYNLYATTEGGLLGAECEHHKGLHMFEDLVIVEPVDHDNQPVPPGVVGNKVLLTVLFGRTMPLIRYELTDCVGFSTSDSCPCGRPFTLVDDPQGRTLGNELYFPSSSGAEVALHPVAFESVMDLFPISGWQVVQELDGLHMLVSGAEAERIDETLLRSMRQALEEHDVIVPSLFIEHVPTIPRGTSGKVTLVVSHTSRTTS